MSHTRTDRRSSSPAASRFARPVSIAVPSLLAVAVALAGVATSCDAGDQGGSTSTGPVVDETVTSTTDGSPRPGAIPDVAGSDDGYGPSIEEQLAAATIPASPDDCRTADLDAVTAIIDTEIALTIGQLDPSGRSLCRYVDADENTLVRVLVTDAAGDPSAASSFTALQGEAGAVAIDDNTVAVGRHVGRLDGSLIEVTVLPEAVPDDGAAAAAALEVLNHLTGGT